MLGGGGGVSSKAVCLTPLLLKLHWLVFVHFNMLVITYEALCGKGLEYLKDYLLLLL